MRKKPEHYIGKRYEATDGYYAVIGFINEPAILLKNPITGDNLTVVIGCNNHLEMKEISDENALAAIEGYCLCKPKHELLEE